MYEQEQLFLVFYGSQQLENESELTRVASKGAQLVAVLTEQWPNGRADADELHRSQSTFIRMERSVG